MSKKFKSIENDEEFKNFKLEDYLPSMPNAERAEKSADAKSEVSDESGSLFPRLKEPDTSVVQTVVSAAVTHEHEEAITELDDIPAERIIARRISSKQRRL